MESLRGIGVMALILGVIYLISRLNNAFIDSHLLNISFGTILVTIHFLHTTDRWGRPGNNIIVNLKTNTYGFRKLVVTIDGEIVCKKIIWAKSVFSFEFEDYKLSFNLKGTELDEEYGALLEHAHKGPISI